MEEFWNLLREYWYYPVAAVCILVPLVLYGAAYLRALQPKAGTLEWIELYDRPSFSLVGRWTGLTRRDGWPLTAAALAAAAAWSFAAWKTLGAGYVTTADLLGAAVHYGLLPLLASVLVYLLVKGLTGSTLSALFSALVLAVDLSAEPLLMVLTAAQALALARYLTAGEEETFGGVCLPLILAFACNAVACYVYSGFLVVTAVLLVLLAVGAAGRFVRLGRGWLLRSLVTAVLSWAAVSVLVYVPGAAAAGMTFPAAFLNGDYYLYAGLRFLAGVHTAFFVMPFDPVPLTFDWLLMACGLAALVTLAAGMARSRDLTGLIGAVWFAGLAAAWLLTGMYALPVGALLCIGSVWGGFCRRTHFFPVLLGSACLLAAHLGLYLFSWFR